MHGNVSVSTMVEYVIEPLKASFISFFFLCKKAFVHQEWALFDVVIHTKMYSTLDNQFYFTLQIRSMVNYIEKSEIVHIIEIISFS